MPTFTTDWFSPHIPSWNKILDSYKNMSVKVLDVGTCDGTWDGIDRLQDQLSNYFVTLEV